MNLVLYNRDTLAQHPALLNELDQLVTRINRVHGVEHDPQTGAHGDITVTGLTWNGAIQTTVGAAGGASALPATPSLYLTITLAGREYVCPLYLAS